MNERPSVIDLFAGVGGLSLGAARAGFRVAAAVELDKRAADAHHVNFPTTKHLIRDVATLKGEELLRETNIGSPGLQGLIGGPPCQGFSIIGRNIADDPRNAMVLHFCRLVAETNPAFFLFENVPGILQDRFSSVIDEAMGRIPRRYTLLHPLRVNARDCGVATNRVRIFFFGYDSSRLAPLTENVFLRSCINATVKVRDALAGLPRIRSHWLSKEEGWRRIEKPSGSDFSRLISGKVPAGVGDAEALRRYSMEGLVSGCHGTIHTNETVERFSRLKPGEMDPVSKARRLDPNGFCPTLRAGTGPERGSFQAVRPVHPSSPRVITPREAARLQGFPDWFVFDHTKWHAFRQIGNSVSPIVAEHLLREVYSATAC
jgi:DNA (cytosine-5)-methyltransferase 1